MEWWVRILTLEWWGDVTIHREEMLKVHISLSHAHTQTHFIYAHTPLPLPNFKALKSDMLQNMSDFIVLTLSTQ